MDFNTISDPPSPWRRSTACVLTRASLCVCVLVVVLSTVMATVRATGMSIIRKKKPTAAHTQGKVVVYSPAELFGLLAHPVQPKRREFESETKFKRRKQEWLKESKELAETRFDVQIPLSCVRLGRYDMKKKGFPVTIKAYRWKYVEQPTMEKYRNVSGYLHGKYYKVGYACFDFGLHPVVLSTLFVQVADAKRIRSQYHNLKVMMRGAKAHVASTQVLYSTESGKSSEHKRFDAICGRWLPHVSSTPRQGYLGKIELEILAFDIPHSKGELEFSLGDKTWKVPIDTFRSSLK